jgi:hypothetical protein
VGGSASGKRAKAMLKSSSPLMLHAMLPASGCTQQQLSWSAPGSSVCLRSRTFVFGLNTLRFQLAMVHASNSASASAACLLHWRHPWVVVHAVTAAAKLFLHVALANHLVSPSSAGCTPPIGPARCCACALAPVGVHLTAGC